MPKYVPIQPSLHKNIGWSGSFDFDFVSKQALVPLYTDELDQLVHIMAIAITQNEHSTSGYELSGVLSLQSGINLYIQEKKWLKSYIPVFFRAYPFALVKSQQSSDLQFCFDSESVEFHNPRHAGDYSLVKEGGAISDRLAELIPLLRGCYQNNINTQQQLAQLRHHNLIVPWKIKLANPAQEEEGFEVKGLYRIDSLALKELDAVALSELRSSGALHTAYCQQFSEQQISNLTEQSKKYQHHKQKSVDLKSLFDDEEGDLLRF